MYEITTLERVKSWTNIKGNAQDNFLESLRDVASLIIENYIDKKIITRQFIEYYDGEGAGNLLVDNYPIYKVDSIYDDTDHEWTSSELLDSDDYRIYYDVGNIYLVDDEVYFYNGIQNVKITYWAGLSRFLVVDEANNYLDITDSGGTVAIEIDPEDDYGRTGYNAEDLATTLQTALNANTTLSNTYTVSYNHGTQKFTISANGSFQILWQSGSNADKNLADLMGFDTGVDMVSGTSDTSDDPVNGTPDDLMIAAEQVCLMLFDMSKQSGAQSIQLMKRKITPNTGTVDLLTEDLPPIARKIMDRYKRGKL